ncbi:hypothetical protein [Enhygromyxa salina]|uniref:Uncharacterized protein n=1 Tax=Enhygromyxa salina TaxID=215803 RepID=A0A2S9YQC2_9BACT|nr:hypothetical protein [Enhygromyxa salina]PRQ07278.1 hypothetical protein ENSA7_29860 [Enhygromyxa salina]
MPISAVVLGALLVGGCLGSGARTRAPASELLAAGWIDASTVGPTASEDPERLAVLADAGLRGRLLRLDRLLDLYDGARFAGDQQARESLWLSLGGYASTRGIEASREVVIRLLDEAYALEDLAAAAASGSLSEDEQRFVADAIMLLSADMFLPDSAESLITQTLAYRVLTQTGHPRIADNAHWRLYDHVRGVLEGALELEPELRADVIVHALYAEQEDLSAWLDDLGPHARPPLPSPSELWSLLERHRAALEQVPRWQAVVAARAPREAELRDTVMALLPRPRDPGWVLSQVPRGTGQAESLAPVVLLEPGSLRLEPTSTTPRELDPRALEDAASAAIEALLVRDGRGTILLASAPDVPAPEYAATLAALVSARTSVIELAVHEAALRDAQPPVVVALPLYIAGPEDLGAGARALRDSRIHVQLSGRGPRVRVDGRWLSAKPTLPSDLLRLVAELHRAYPREHTVSLSLATNVQHQQLVDLLAAVSGGLTPAFLAVGWVPGAALVGDPVGDPAGDRALAARLQLGPDSLAFARAVTRGPQPAADEWARFERTSDSIIACVTELEAPLPKRGVTLALSFDEHKLVELNASGAKLGRAQLDAYEACAKERLAGFRLRVPGEPFTASLEVHKAKAPE